MQALNISRNTRLIFMTITIATVAAFGIFGAGWATPARADGGSGTVPPVGGGNGGGNGSGGGSNPTAVAAAIAVAGGCGTGAQTFTRTGADNVTKLIDVGIGTVTLLSNQGGVGTGAIRLLFAPISSLTVDLVASALLNPSPAGWTNLGCGILNNAKVSDGQTATYILKGQRVCFNLPLGAAEAYKNLRIAYFDTGLARWVFLNTTVGITQACHSSFRLAPATFALFGSS